MKERGLMGGGSVGLPTHKVVVVPTYFLLEELPSQFIRHYGKGFIKSYEP